MAVVLEYTTEGGTTIRVHDDSYVNATPEEIERRFQHINDTVARLVMKNSEKFIAAAAASANSVNGFK